MVLPLYYRENEFYIPLEIDVVKYTKNLFPISTGDDTRLVAFLKICSDVVATGGLKHMKLGFRYTAIPSSAAKKQKVSPNTYVAKEARKGRERIKKLVTNIRYNGVLRVQINETSKYNQHSFGIVPKGVQLSHAKILSICISEALPNNHI